MRINLERFLSQRGLCRAMPGHSQEHPARNSHGTREIAILLTILGGLIVLVARPFGYRVFQIDLQQHDVLPVILILGIVGVVFIILQRQGIIFADSITSLKN